MSDLQLRLMRSESANERSRLLDQLVEHERRLELTRTERMETSTKWFNRPVPLNHIQASLGPEEVILEYVLDEPDSYCLWVSKRGVGVLTLSGQRHQIEDLVEKYLGAIRAKRDDSASAKQLYDVLLGQVPSEANRRRVIVVPDGILNLLPFDTLRDSKDNLVLESRTAKLATSPPAHAALQRHQASDEPVDRPAVARGVSV